MGDVSPNFSRHEFKCNCGKCDCDTIDYEILECLEAIRQHFDRVVIVTSAHRCPEHNKNVGGAKNSQHLYGRAVDIVVDSIHPNNVYTFVKSKFPDISTGVYPGFIHLDSRTDGPKRW
ncbi:MAG: YcbK family protein [Rickettsiales bacterium]